MQKQEIRIGGICYSIYCDDDINVNEGLGQFLDSGGTDVRLTCQLSIVKRSTKSSIQKLQLREHIIFEADTTWGLYGISNFILTVPSLRSGSRTQLSAEFDRDFESGTVYISKARIDDFLYPFLEVLTIILLGKGHGALLHASCVNDNGRGYLFVGPSGAGKSTISNLWDEKPGVEVLSDDRVIVAASDDVFLAYGTPWYGTGGYAISASVLVDMIFFIGHGDSNTAAPVKGIMAVSELVRNAFLPFWNSDGLEYSIDLLSRIGQRVPVFDLCFLPHKEVVDYVRSVCR